MKIENRKAPLIKNGVFSFIFVLINTLSFAAGEGEFLNPGVTYRVLEEDVNIFRAQPPQTRLVIIDFKRNSSESNYRYYLKGQINDLKLQLMEYDFFSRLYLRNDMISLRVLDMLSEEEIFRFHRKLYEHFHGFHNLKYPPEVDEIHKAYLEILDDAEGYLDFEAGEDKSIFDNSTIIYRIMRLYNTHTNQRKLLEATLRLDKLLEANGIQPY